MKSIKTLVKDAYYYYLLKCTRKYQIGEQLLTRRLRFYKEDYNWFVDLPEWQGSKAQLIMVAGADEVCELLADHQNDVTLDVTNDIEQYRNWRATSSPSIVHIAEQVNDGGDYIIKTMRDKKIWLCSVNQVVWGSHPRYIYFKVV